MRPSFTYTTSYRFVLRQTNEEFPSLLWERNTAVTETHNIDYEKSCLCPSIIPVEEQSEQDNQSGSRLFSLLFNPDDKGHMFLRNVGRCTTDCAASYSRIYKLFVKVFGDPYLH
jgi:hypothetical protein